MTMRAFDPHVTIHTKRLLLRYMEEADTHDIFQNINHDPEVLRFFIDKYVEKEEDMTLGRTIAYCLEAKRYLFAIVLKETGETIGMLLECSTPTDVFPNVEIGFAIGKPHWNQGYVTEAVQAVVPFLFKQGVHRITASHIVENEASGKVMRKCGMAYQGRHDEEVFYHGTYHDLDWYYLLAPTHPDNH
ncbi:MAG: GNAT family N-acetyltransferase [Bacilli bacterium]|nr:GNAT family N-acetyltransferase [Bacilli bacterium]